MDSTIIQRKWQDVTAFATFLLLSAIIPISLVVSNDNVIVLRDLNIPALTPAAQWSYTTTSWDAGWFGHLALEPLGDYVTYLFIALTHSALATQLFIDFYLPLLVGSVAAYFLLKEIIRPKNSILLVPATALYIFNWLVFVQIGATWWIYVYMGLPALFLFLFRLWSSSSGGLINSAGIALALCFQSMFVGLQGPVLAFPVGCCSVAAGFMAFLFSNSSASPLKQRTLLVTKFAGTRILLTLLAVAFFILLTLPFSFEAFLGSLPSVRGLAAAAGISIIISPPSFISSFPTIPSEINLLTGDTGVLFISYLAADLIVIVCSVSFFSSELRVRLVATFSAILLLLAILFIELIKTGNPIVQLFYSFSPMLAFDSPGKVYLILAPILAILFGLGVASILVKLHRSVSKVYALLLIVVIASATTMILSDNLAITRFASLPGQKLSPDFTAVDPPQNIPNYLINLVDFFNDTSIATGPFRVLWLPSSFWTTFVMGSLDVNGVIFPLTSVTSNQTLFNFTNVLEKLGERNTTDFGALLVPFGFRYVVVLRQFEGPSGIGISTYEGTPSWLSGGPDVLIAALSKQSDLNPVLNTTDYLVFENTATNPQLIGRIQLSPATQSETLRVASAEPLQDPESFRVEVNATAGALLVLADNYSPNWIAYDSTNGRTSSLEHTKAYGWANGFVLPTNGTLDITIQFISPKSYLYEIWYIAILILVLSSAAFLVVRPRGHLSLSFRLKRQHVPATKPLRADGKEIHNRISKPLSFGIVEEPSG